MVSAFASVHSVCVPNSSRTALTGLRHRLVWVVSATFRRLLAAARKLAASAVSSVRSCVRFGSCRPLVGGGVTGTEQARCSRLWPVSIALCAARWISTNRLASAAYSSGDPATGVGRSSANSSGPSTDHRTGVFLLAFAGCLSAGASIKIWMPSITLTNSCTSFLSGKTHVVYVITVNNAPSGALGSGDYFQSSSEYNGVWVYYPCQHTKVSSCSLNEKIKKKL